MKEGFGGTFMIYVLLVFLAVYIVFVAVAFNYARAFKVKNKIIDYIEQNEGIRDYNNKNGIMNDIDSYLASVSYLANISENDCPGYDFVGKRGYCIDRVGTINEGYYRVVVFFEISIPIIDDFSITVPVKGETRKIVRLNT